MYMHTNPNPRNHEIDDCVVRAIAVVNGDYYDTCDGGDEEVRYIYAKENNLLAAIEEKEKSDGIGGNIQNKSKE